MRKIVTLSFIIITTFGFAQDKYKVGDSFFEKMEYTKAAQEYESFVLNGDDSKEVLQKIGDSYYFNTDMNAANEWYGKLIEKYEKDVESKYFFRHAQSFIGINKNRAAKKWTKVFLDKKSDSKREIVVQKETIENQQVFELNNLSINTSYSDFAPVFYGNQLIFASNYKPYDSLSTKSNSDQPPFLNLYIGSITPQGTDVHAVSEFSDVLNSNFHEATLSFSADLKKVYYTRNNHNEKSGKSNGDDNRLKIYSAISVKDKNGYIVWKDNKELPFNSEKYSVGHPTLSPDGTKLYFVSDMPGTIGKTDIFVVDILDNDEYSNPRNLGVNVNSTEREMFPFMTEHILYFASEGYDGYGGLDIFESEFDTIFKTPINLGAPLNSVYDDFGFIINEQTNNGFVCSNRNLGKGEDDIYFFNRTILRPSKQFMNGYISNNITGERISDATVTLFTNEGETLEQSFTKIDGSFAFQEELSYGSEYVMNIQKKGFNDAEKTVVANGETGEVVVPIGMDRLDKLIIEEDGLLKIKVGVIYFDLNSSDVRKDAALEFDKVVTIMNQYPRMVISIGSHTDSRGPDEYNLALSSKRARVARDYIISKGINPERINDATGYGETQLMNDCKDGVKCSESMHQLNRRSEFVIIRM